MGKRINQFATRRVAKSHDITPAMNYSSVEIRTEGEKFYNITADVQRGLQRIVEGAESAVVKHGVLHLFTTHTSCALTISEAFDPSAADDMASFLGHLAPPRLPFITHTSEGLDDSPSHMKSILLQQSLGIIVESGKMVLGQWQGIYLAEFRHSPKKRTVLLKFIAG